MNKPIQDIVPVTVKDTVNKPNNKSVPSPVTDQFKRMVAIVDANVLPIAAWFAIAGLAVRGAMTLLANTSGNVQILIAVAVVSFLAFKLR